MHADPTRTNRLRKPRRPTSTGRFFAALLVGAAAGAQERADTGIPEVVVTAERRLADIQSVPLSVAAVTEDDVSALVLRESVDLASAIPGLQFDQQGMGATPFVRGVGAMSGAVGNEAPVSMYVDGVYLSMPNASIFSLDGVRQVEVLKGPQGTLFGRNATGGVIQVNTREPLHAPAAEVRLQYATDDTARGSVYATRGFGDAIAASVSANARRQSDGWGANQTTGEPTFRHQEHAARGKLSWEPSATTRVAFSASHYHRRGEDGIGYHLVPGALGLDGVTAYTGFYDAWANPQDRASYRHSVVSSRVERDLSGLRLVNILAWQELEGFFNLDQDATPAAIVNAPITQYGRTITEEFQVLSRPDTRWEWIAGLYYLRDVAAYDPLELQGLISMPLFATEIHSRQGTESYAAFGQTTGRLTDRLHLTVGSRYTRDEREIAGETLGHTGADMITLASAQQAAEWSKPTWRVALAHNVSQTFMAYVSWDRGFKSGVYNLLNYADAPVDPEELDAYQAGFKSGWLDDRLRLNLAAFRYRYRNIQVETIVAGATIALNAAAARMRGMDFDLEYAPSRAFMMRAAFAFLDGHYTDFANAPITTPRRDQSGQLIGGNLVVSGNATGLRTVRSPSRTAVLNTRYRFNPRFGEVGMALGYYHNSGFAWDPDNRLKQQSYGTLSASIDWTSVDKRMLVRAAASNLNDSEVCVYASATALGDLCSPRAPRSLSVDLSLSF